MNKNNYQTNQVTATLSIESRNKLLYEIIVDLVDLEMVQKFHWTVQSRAEGRYLYIYCSKYKIYLHHLIGEPSKDEYVFFKNGDPLDCRRCNLNKTKSMAERQAYYFLTQHFPRANGSSLGRNIYHLPDQTKRPYAVSHKLNGKWKKTSCATLKEAIALRDHYEKSRKK